MSETLSSPDIELVDEETERIEVDVPDGMEDEFLGRIRLVDVAAEDEEDLELKKASYRDWGEMKAVAALKKGEGVWQQLDCLPAGTEIHLGDISGFVKKQAAVERQVRAKNSKYRKVSKKTGKVVELPNDTQTDIFIVASHGTAVLGWRGPGFQEDGKPVEFNIDNYAEAVRDFDEFRLEVQSKMLNLNPAALEAVRGNS